MVYTIFAIDSLGELVCYWLLVGMHHPPRACLFFRRFAHGIGIHMGGNVWSEDGKKNGSETWGQLVQTGTNWSEDGFVPLFYANWLYFGLWTSSR